MAIHIAKMKRPIKFKYFSELRKIVSCLLIIKAVISPIESSEIDYMYDLADGSLGEEGFEFGDVFDFPSLNRNTSGIVTFDIGMEKNHQSKQSSANETPLKDVEGWDKNGINEKFISRLSPAGDYTFGTLLVIFGFLSLVGNGSILLVFCFRHRRISPVEVFLVNLGIVDILLAIASYPMSMISSFKHQWPFGEIGCTAYAFVCYFLGVASIFSVTAIAIIRYLKTCTPVLGNRITCWTSCKMIAWGYVISLIWALMPLLGFGKYSPEPFGLSCTLEWVAKDEASKMYILMVTVFCVFLPLFVILFSYTHIILLVKQSDALVRSSGVNKRNTKSDVQLTWISGLVTLGFIIGWGPYTIVSLWASYRGEVVIPMWITPIPVLMAKSSIAYNPLVYIFFTARYREDFKAMLQHWLHFHFKGNEQNNNGNVIRRTGSNRANMVNKQPEQDNSPRISASSSQTTRQFTSTTGTATMQITNNNIAADISSCDDEIPLEQISKNLKEKIPIPYNNNVGCHNFDDSGCKNENFQEEESEQDHLLNPDHHNKSVIIVRDQNGNRRQSQPNPTSHVVTMFTGNGVSTVVSSSSNSFKAFSAAKRYLVASSSLFSLRSVSSGNEEGQQV